MDLPTQGIRELIFFHFPTSLSLLPVARGRHGEAASMNAAIELGYFYAARWFEWLELCA